MSGIPSDQVLAILRLRQWAVESKALKCGRSTRLTNAGWRERRETDADARTVPERSTSSKHSPRWTPRTSSP